MNGALKADGFDDCIVGVGTQFNDDVVVYDVEKILDQLVREGLTPEEAVEHFEFNIAGAYVGSNTPLFLRWKDLGSYLETLDGDDDGRDLES